MKKIITILMLVTVTMLYYSCKKSDTPLPKDIVNSALVNKWYLQRTTMREYGFVIDPALDTIYRAGPKDTIGWIKFNADASGFANVYPATNFTFTITGQTLVLIKQGADLPFVIDRLPLPGTDTLVSLTNNSAVIRANNYDTVKGPSGESVRVKDVYLFYYVSDKKEL